MTHPLHDDKFIAMGGSTSSNRMTGRSTALAFRYIAEAIRTPGQPIEIVDHLGTYEANKVLSMTIWGIIEKTGLKHLNLKENKNQKILTLTFERQA